MLTSLTITVDLSFLLHIIGFCFVYFGALLLDTEIFMRAVWGKPSPCQYNDSDFAAGYLAATLYNCVPLLK